MKDREGRFRGREKDGDETIKKKTGGDVRKRKGINWGHFQAVRYGERSKELRLLEVNKGEKRETGDEKPLGKRKRRRETT